MGPKRRETLAGEQQLRRRVRRSCAEYQHQPDQRVTRQDNTCACFNQCGVDQANIFYQRVTRSSDVSVDWTKQLNICRFIVHGGSPGLKITKIENKVSLRVVQNCNIQLENVFVPDDDRLPGANCFQDLVNVRKIAP